MPVIPIVLGQHSENTLITNQQNVNGGLVQNAIASTSTTAASAIPSFGSTFGYNDYAIQGTSGQANQGAMLNYSTNTTQPAFPGIQSTTSHKLYILQCELSNRSHVFVNDFPCLDNGWQLYQLSKHCD